MTYSAIVHDTLTAGFVQSLRKSGGWHPERYAALNSAVRICGPCDVTMPHGLWPSHYRTRAHRRHLLPVPSQDPA